MILLLLNFLFTLVANAAEGQLITKPFHIVSTSPPVNGWDSSALIRAHHHLATCKDPDLCGDPQPRTNAVLSPVIAYNSAGAIVDFERRDGTPFMECLRVYNAAYDTTTYFVRFERKPDTIAPYVHHPGVNGADAWPHSVSCTASYGGDTVVTQSVLAPWAQTNIPPVTINLTTGYSITVTKNLETSNCSNIVTQKLPSGNYVSGWVAGKKAGPVNWTGVDAYIQEAGATDYISYRYICHATAGTGYIPLVRNGVTRNVPFTLTKQ